MSSRTKERILQAALSLFNEKGMVHVRLQHIADAAGISVGNLAYHYYGKEAIVFALIDELMKEQSVVLANYSAVPLFVHIDNILEQNFSLQSRFEFFYLDTLEIYRMYKKVARLSERHISNQLMQIEGMFNFNAARGAFIKNADYASLARTFWMAGHLWRYQQRLTGKTDFSLKEYKEQLWAVLLPFCTEMGIMEYRTI